MQIRERRRDGNIKKKRRKKQEDVGREGEKRIGGAEK